MQFTKEQLIEHIKGRKEFADECAADSTLHPERREYYELTAEALRIALASLEAEAVAYTEKCEITNMQATGLYLRGFPDNSQGRDIGLYTAPPAPVVPDMKELVAILDWILMLPCPTPKATLMAKRLAVVIDACRAAMLNQEKSNG